MMTAADRPDPISAFSAREIVPAGWMRPPEDKSPFQMAKENFARWNRSLSEGEKLADEHVYSNPDFTLLDARQHRALLHNLIGHGEMLAADFITLNLPGETESYVIFIDQQLSRLNGVLREWHGPVEGDADIPNDFAVGMREVSEGKTVDLEKALHEQPAQAAAGNVRV